MLTLYDYLLKMGIKEQSNKIKTKEIFFNKIVYYKENKAIDIYVSCKKIQNSEELKKLELLTKKQLKYFQEVKLILTYNELDINNVYSMLTEYWDNILFVLKTLVPSISFLPNELSWNIKDRNLEICLCDEILMNRLNSKNAQFSLKNIISQELGLDFCISFALKNNSKVNMDEYITRKDEETASLLDRIIVRNDNESPNISEEIKPSDSGEKVEGNIILGKDNKDDVEKIINIHPEIGKISIQGEVFDLDVRELKGGRTLLTISVTDYSSSIKCKLFLRDNLKDSIADNVKKGSYLKIRGNVMFDNYSQEIILNILDMEKKRKFIKTDKAVNKRVELHAPHTNVSNGCNLFN